MENESKEKVVAMLATFKTDGNDEKRERTISQVMSVYRILGAPTLQDAIEYFQSQVPYIDSIEDFKFFTIEGETYTPDFWI